MATVVDGEPELQEEAGIMHHVLTQLLRYQVSVVLTRRIIILWENQLQIQFLIKRAYINLSRTN